MKSTTRAIEVSGWASHVAIPSCKHSFFRCVDLCTLLFPFPTELLSAYSSAKGKHMLCDFTFLLTKLFTRWRH